MRNLNSFMGNTSDFLDEIVASKRNSSEDPNYKFRLSALVPNIKLHYSDFDLAFNHNNYISLTPNGYVNQEKDDLLKLYTPNNSRLVKLKNSITTVLDNRAMNTCQYCTLAPIGSLDHIIPKDEFPEFSVNPKNLLPSCSICNSHKKEHWKLINKTLFINLYTDILPDEQYLFVDITITLTNIEPNFELRNVNHIDNDFFELLESHYSRLQLLQRFRNESHKVISELSNLIFASLKQLTQSQIIILVKDKIIEDKRIFGMNYYKSILEEALITDQDYLDSFS
jgi:5-methylcytosine-specific restriction endonuclease McrA